MNAAMPSVENLHADSPRGMRLEMLANLPDGAGPFPALVLAPGNRYHMRQPILEQIATSGAQNGVAVFRFDWAHGNRECAADSLSEDLVAETQDMMAVATIASMHANVDSRRVFVGGKSVGSVVAWKLFSREPTLAGAVLVTPLFAAPAHRAMTRSDEHETFYAGLGNEQRPVLLLGGDQDPHCNVASVNHVLAGARYPFRFDILRGGHDLREPGQSESPAEHRSSIVMAGQLVAQFIAARSEAWQLRS